MTYYSPPVPAVPEPAAPKRASFAGRPLVRLVSYVLSWFVFTMSLALTGYAFLFVAQVGGFCASGSSAYVIQTQCPAIATDFLPWTIFTGLIAVGVAVALAGGIGIQLRVWAWPLLFCGGGVLFLLGGGVTGWLCGILFLIMGLVPLVLELRASVQRVFLGSFNIFGQQFKEGAKAQPSFSSRKMPNPPDAIRAGIGDWAVAVLGFLVPVAAGLSLATYWVALLIAR